MGKVGAMALAASGAKGSAEPAYAAPELGAMILPLVVGLLLAVPACGENALPDDETLMEGMDLKKSYTAMQALIPRIEASESEVAAIRDSQIGKTERNPGGPRRDEARAELALLRQALLEERQSFNRREVKTRAMATQAILLAINVQQGKNDDANESIQRGYQHIQIARDSKELLFRIDALLKQEAAVHEEALARWRIHEEHRLLLRGAVSAALIIPAGVLFWRWRSRRALLAADGESLGRWRVGKAPRPWAFGTRWDGSDGGSGTTGSVRLFDERLCAPPASPQKLLAALDAAAAPGLPGAPLESFIEGTSVILVFPSTHAKPLSKWIEKGRAVPPAQAIVFLRRLAPTLDAAHRTKKAHGGLSPDCVLVGADGAVILEDFGVAVALAAVGAPVSAMPAYSAPELEAGRFAPPADLYSVGVLFYELVTGSYPFEGTNLQAMKLEKRYTPLSRLVKGCPPALNALVDSLLEPDPARRRPLPGGLEAALKALA